MAATFADLLAAYVGGEEKGNAALEVFEKTGVPPKVEEPAPEPEGEYEEPSKPRVEVPPLFEQPRKVEPVADVPPPAPHETLTEEERDAAFAEATGAPPMPAEPEPAPAAKAEPEPAPKPWGEAEAAAALRQIYEPEDPRYVEPEPEPDSDDQDDDKGTTAAGLSGMAGGALGKVTEHFEKHPGHKRPAIFGAAALVLALVIGLFSSGSPESPRVSTPSAVPTAAPVPEPEPEYTEVRPISARAECGPNSTSASLAFDGKKETAWQCTRVHGADGAMVRIVFDKTVRLKDVLVVPGFDYVQPNGKDRWTEFRLVRDILWMAHSGKDKFHQPIMPSRSGGIFSFGEKGIVVKEIRATIQKSVLPSEVGSDAPVDDTDILPVNEDAQVADAFAISSITFHGEVVG